MKSLPRAAAVALLVSCASSPGGNGFVVVALHTNDLVIPDDAGLIGLYLTQLDEAGRSSRLLTSEVVVDPPPQEIRFPSSLTVVSNGDNARIQTRLIAFRRGTREPLTMRESQATVPTDVGALLRLNLFFTNAGNVVDDLPGEPVPTGAPVDPAGGSLAFRRVEGGGDPYARFHSLCDGQRAPANQTAGDDGHCVDVVATLVPYVEKEGVPGTAEDDTCYDVLQTFDPRSDGAVPQVDTSTLPLTGDCRVPLPRSFEPSMLNVALVGQGGFEATAQYGGKLRPLAATVAFTQEPGAIVLPERVCALARAGSLVFSQRTAQWGGAEPVCSPFARAKGARSYDGPVPGPGPDAGPDAAAPSFAAYDVTGATAPLTSMAARNGEVALLTSTDDLDFAVTRQPAASFELATVQTASFRTFFASNSASLRAVSLGVGGPAVFYVDRPEEGLALLDADVTLPLVQNGPVGHRAAIAQIGGQGQVGWTENAGDGGLGSFRLAPLSATDPVVVGSGFTVKSELPGNVDLLPVLGAIGTDRIALPAGRFDAAFYDCTLGGTCARKVFTAATSVQIDTAVRVGTHLVGFYFDNGLGTVFVDYGAPELGSTQTVDNPIHAVPVGDRVCGIYKESSTGIRRVRCHDLGALQRGEEGTLVMGPVESAALDADEQYLYVAYQCAEAPGTVHVVRVPHAAVTENAVPVVCTGGT